MASAASDRLFRSVLSMFTDCPERQLIDACRDVQDERFESAFEELYRRYRDRVYSIAFRMTGSATDAMDVVQDAFRVLFLKISTFRFDAQFSTWLFRIVVNCSIDHRRRERVRDQKRNVSLSLVESFMEPADNSDGPEALAQSSELGAHVQSALQRLSPKLRAVMVLRYLEGLSYEELADTLQLQLGTVKSRLARAHIAMESVLSGRLAEFGYEPASATSVAHSTTPRTDQPADRSAGRGLVHRSSPGAGPGKPTSEGVA